MVEADPGEAGLCDSQRCIQTTQAMFSHLDPAGLDDVAGEGVLEMLFLVYHDKRLLNFVSIP